jgi:hypothetical protein
MVEAYAISSRMICPATSPKRKYCNGRMQIALRCTAKKALDAVSFAFNRWDTGDHISASRHFCPPILDDRFCAQSQQPLPSLDPPKDHP